MGKRLRGSVENCPLKRVSRGSVRAPEGFSEDKPQGLPEENPAHWPEAQCRHPRHSPEGTVIPLCPKDFQQLLRLPKSWGLLANEARRHPIPNFCAPYSELLRPYSKLLRPLIQTSAPAAVSINQWEAQKLISHFTIVQCESLTLYLGAVWELVVSSSH